MCNDLQLSMQFNSDNCSTFVSDNIHIIKEFATLTTYLTISLVMN